MKKFERSSKTMNSEKLNGVKFEKGRTIGKFENRMTKFETNANFEIRRNCFRISFNRRQWIPIFVPGTAGSFEFCTEPNL